VSSTRDERHALLVLEREGSICAVLRNKIRLRKEQCSQPRRCLRTVAVSLYANSGGVAVCEQWWYRCMRTVVVSLYANSGGVDVCEQW
jgi:hypothetical protein